MSYIEDNFIFSDYSKEKFIGIVDNNAIQDGVITIPEGVTTLGVNAFAEAHSLRQINLPASLESIENKALDGAVNLSRVTVSPENPTFFVVSNIVFSYLMDETVVVECTIVACPQGVRGNIDISGDNAGLTEEEKDRLIKINKIEDYAFYRCSHISSLKIADTIKSIHVGNFAFTDCYRMKSNNVLSKEMTHVGDYAFRNNRGIDVPKITFSCDTIGVSAFKACTGLTKVELVFASDEDVNVNVNEHAFAACTGLLEVRLSSNQNIIFHECAFYKDELLGRFILEDNTKYNTKQKIVTFCDKCFMGCGFNVWNPLGDVGDWRKEDNIEPIYHGEVFNSCEVLYEVHISTIPTVDFDSLFANCNRIFSVNVYRTGCVQPLAFTKNVRLARLFLDGMERIGYSAFRSCPSLPSVEIPVSVGVIERWAFAYCQSLTKVNIVNSQATTDGDAFKGSNAIEEAHIPLRSNDDISIRKGMWRNLSKAKVMYQSSGNWGSGVDTIPDYYYDGCYSLERVYLDSRITNLGDFAFNNCYSLSFVHFPKDFSFSSESMPKEPFRGCYNLNSVSVSYSDGLNNAFLRGGFFTQFGLTNIELRANGNGVISGFLNTPEIYNNLLSIHLVNETGKFSEVTDSFNYGSLIKELSFVNTIKSISGSFKTSSSLLRLYILNTNASVVDSFSRSAPLEEVVIPINKIKYKDENKNELEAPFFSYFTGTSSDGVDVTIGSYDIDPQTDNKLPVDILFASNSTVNKMSKLTVSPNITSLSGNSNFVHWNNQKLMTDVSASASLLTENTQNSGVVRLGLEKPKANAQARTFNLFLVGNKSSGEINVGYFGFSTDVLSGDSSNVIPCIVEEGGKYHSLTSVEFKENPDGEKDVTLGEGAFFKCVELANVTSLNKVESIGALSFFGCLKLKNLAVYGDNLEIGGGAFNGMPNDAVLNIYNTASNITHYYSYTNSNRLVFKSNMSGSERTLVSMIGDVPTSVITVTNNDATTISKYAFMGSNNLKEIVANSISAVAPYSFANCINLASVTMTGIDDTNPLINVGDAIGDYAFYGCGSLKKVKFSNYMKRIGAYAFALPETPVDSTLVTLKIPNSLNYVGVGAFLNRTDFDLVVGMPQERFKVVFRIQKDGNGWKSDTGLNNNQIRRALQTCR